MSGKHLLLLTVTHTSCQKSKHAFFYYYYFFYITFISGHFKKMCLFSSQIQSWSILSVLNISVIKDHIHRTLHSNLVTLITIIITPPPPVSWCSYMTSCSWKWGELDFDFLWLFWSTVHDIYSGLLWLTLTSFTREQIESLGEQHSSFPWLPVYMLHIIMRMKSDEYLGDDVLSIGSCLFIWLGLASGFEAAVRHRPPAV